MYVKKTLKKRKTNTIDKKNKTNYNITYFERKKI